MNRPAKEEEQVMTCEDKMEPNHRQPRSYVLRRGRVTNGQARALRKHWPHFGLDSGSKFDPMDIFSRQGPLVVEIGIGDGTALIEMAAAAPQKNFIGIDVYPSGLGRALIQVVERRLTNVRLVCDDAVKVFENCLSESNVDEINIFFPDPWPKKKHHKRRLLNDFFIKLIAPQLTRGGCIHLATDCQDYAEQALALFETTEGLVNTAGKQQYSPRPKDRPLTKYERRAIEMGNDIWEICICRQPS